MKRTLSLLSLAVIALFGSLGLASSASAAEAPACAPASPGLLLIPGSDMNNKLLTYTITPNPWTVSMQGQTVSVTVTGKTQAVLDLALLSYKTTTPVSWPQTLYQAERFALNGCETVTKSVEVPKCSYQVDFINAMGLSSEQLKTSEFTLFPVIEAKIGGSTNCDFTPPPPPPPPPPTTTTTTTTSTTPTTPTTPTLPPVTRTLVGVSTTPTTTTPTNGAGSKRACSSVTARGYRVRAKQRNTITVKVKTTSKSRPTVRLSGAGVRVSKRVSATGTVTFKVKPSKAGRIRVTATGCVKVAGVKVMSAKKAQRSGTTPTFTG